MILRLVWRSISRRPGRSALLLAGYALGVGVTVALLSIGSALLEQARDRELVGGGDLTVLPAGLDLETFKTGGVSSLYFTVEQAPFLYRQVLAGPRFDDRIAAAAPWIDDELIYVGRRQGGAMGPGSGRGAGEGTDPGDLTAVSAGGRVPGLSRALGVRAEVVAGRWEDGTSDRRWRSPGDSALYAGLDAFHLPPEGTGGKSAWAEWHYFNVLLPRDRGWLYLTYMVAGAVPDGRWGGRLLATLVEPVGAAAGGDARTRPGAPGADGGAAAGGAADRGGATGRGRPDGRDGGPHPAPGSGPAPPMRVRTYEAEVPARRVSFSLARPDLRIGDASVALDGAGVYRLSATIPPAGGEGGPELRIDLSVRAASRQHLPPLEISGGGFPSGYTAPLLDGRASGRVCVGGRCRDVEARRAYHDHNWGVWRAVTWDWGHAHLGARSVLYGGVRRDAELLRRPGAGGDAGADGPDLAATGGGRFLFLSDTLGFLGLFSVDSLVHRWPERAGPRASPRSIRLRAARPPDSIRLDVDVRHGRVTEAYAAGAGASGEEAGPGGAAEGRRRGIAPGDVRPPADTRTLPRAWFHQMEGAAALRGRLGGEQITGRGSGFFETWRVGVDWPRREREGGGR